MSDGASKKERPQSIKWHAVSTTLAPEVQEKIDAHIDRLGKPERDFIKTQSAEVAKLREKLTRFEQNPAYQKMAETTRRQIAHLEEMIRVTRGEESED